MGANDAPKEISFSRFIIVINFYSCYYKLKDNVAGQGPAAKEARSFSVLSKAGPSFSPGQTTTWAWICRSRWLNQASWSMTWAARGFTSRRERNSGSVACTDTNNGDKRCSSIRCQRIKADDFGVVLRQSNYTFSTANGLLSGPGPCTDKSYELRLVFLTSAFDRGSTAIDLISNKGTANSPGRNRPDPVVLLGKCASQGSTWNAASEGSFQAGILVLCCGSPHNLSSS